MLLISACGPNLPSGLDQDTLRTLTCTGDDLPNEFYLQNDGTFVPENLADLTGNRDAVLAAYRDMGMVGGYFTLWSESLPRPPFEPPTTILCQALQFRDADGARQFLGSLSDDPRGLASVGLSWLPGATVAAEAMPPPDLPAEARAWLVESDGAGRQVQVYLVMFPTDAYVLAVYAGGEDVTQLRSHAGELGRLLWARATQPE